MAYMNDPPLAGRTVAVPKARELEVFAALLERLFAVGPAAEAHAALAHTLVAAVGLSH
jgi:hypothetical protein